MKKFMVWFVSKERRCLLSWCVEGETEEQAVQAFNDFMSNECKLTLDYIDSVEEIEANREEQ